LVNIDYEPLPPVVDVRDAMKAGAPIVHAEAPGNICYVWALGDKAAVDAAFAKAAHVTTLEFINNRLIPNAIEPRACNAMHTRADDSYTLYCTSQNPHVERLLMTAFVLGLPEHKVRVIAPDVGGGFGSKIYLYAEETMCVWASKKVGRPIKWTAERMESFVSDAHGRDHFTRAELALDKDGKFLALRVKTAASMGAYLSTFASCIPTILYATLLAGQYTTPAIHCEVTAVFTNTAPVDAYRGAGRPEATYVVERLVATAAREMNIAQDEIRRRNFIRKFPYATPVALTYDTGDYDACLDGAMEMAGVAGFAARKAESAKRGWGIPLISRPAAWRRPTSPARSARARDCSSAARCACTRRARSRSSPDRTATARATRPRSRRWWPIAWAWASTTWRSCTATPAASPSAWAPTARAPSPWEAPRS
jgi:carbon-monoxide dehydrogenase large subunit